MTEHAKETELSLQEMPKELARAQYLKEIKKVQANTYC